MSILITLDSSYATNQRSDNFVTPFSPPLSVHPKAEIALVSADIWYSWVNISPEYQNNIFRYFDGTAYKTIVIPTGNYQVSQLNSYIRGQMRANTDYDVANDESYIVISPNYSTLRCRLEFSQAAIVKGIKVDFTTVGLGASHKLRELLGFQDTEYTQTSEGLVQVDITRGVNSIQIHTDIHDGSVEDGSSGDVIWNFVPDRAPGALLSVNPTSRIYLPVRSDRINQMRVWITDHQGRRVDLRGESTSYKFEIRSPVYDNKELVDAINKLAEKSA